MIKMTGSVADKYATWSDWYKLAKLAKRYINEGNDCFSAVVGGFTLTFDRNCGNENKRSRGNGNERDGL